MRVNQTWALVFETAEAGVRASLGSNGRCVVLSLGRRRRSRLWADNCAVLLKLISTRQRNQAREAPIAILRR